MRQSTIDQTLGYTAAATPVPADEGGGFNPAVLDMATCETSCLPGWAATEQEALGLANELLGMGSDLNPKR
ncbi:hypothetical protein [Roseibium album]|uniref:hypothetical protein n=1 Tax=Roseibium album TaxID=311410 RepID=UPI00391CEFD2